MAKRSNNPAPTSSNAAPRANTGRPTPPPRSTAAPAQPGFTKRYQHLLIPAAIALITWLFLSVCLGNQFTNWDDPGYIKDNSLIKDISAEGIKNIFTTPVMGNYHPLTILSYAIEYSFVRLQPWLYHLDSLLLHILVTMLVYAFILLLTRRTMAAAVTALLFGLHPMHMESVAWLAGRKDVLYGSFYMAACITHIYFIRKEGTAKWRWYIAGILLFICALLAKPVAVVLPVTLLLIDYWEQRKLNLSLLTEKIPHFALAILFGIRSIADQHSVGALDTVDTNFNFLQRIALGFYALITYLWKAILPIDLSCFYPYPEKVDGTLPSFYYIYPLIAIALLFVAVRLLRKNRVAVFGILFFLVNVGLLLQFIPVGGAIIADRYSYIPYLGLFFIAGWFVSSCFEPGGQKQFAYPSLAIVGIYCLCLGYMSYQRCTAWYDTTSLWRDEIEHHPNTANAYNDLGFNYANMRNESTNAQERQVYYDSSYYLLKKAIALQPTFVNPYVSIGELLRGNGQFAEAKQYYYTALAIKKNDKVGEIYLGLAIVYAINQNLDSSRYCFRQAIAQKTYFPEAHSNYGNLLDMANQRDSALVQYGIAITQNPDNDAFHLNRGRTLQRMERWNEAMADFQQAIALNPTLGDNYYARSFIYAHAGNKAAALQDVQKAASLGFQHISPEYLQSLQH